MKMLFFYCSLLLSVLVFSPAKGQQPVADTLKDSTRERFQVAVFVPLYLDSAFDEMGEYRYDKTFPKFISPGLEFYEGVQLAADSLGKMGIPLDVYIYDTKSVANPVTRVIETEEFKTIDLIIGHVSNNEVRFFAEVAKMRNIPFINSNIPNAAGVTDNPSLVILNSTIKTHTEAIYRYIQRNYVTSPVVLFTKKGAQEDMLRSYFSDIENSSASVRLKIKYVTLTNNFTAAQLAAYLDSNRLTMAIGASFDETFAKHLSRHLASLKETYPVQLFGMPTWDGITDFAKKEYKDLDIYYTTPFYSPKSDRISNSISNYFKTNFFSRPTDMVFRGYECLMRFGQLLATHGPNVTSSIGEKKFKVFTDYDIQPVFLNRQNLTLDYFENRKLYFIRTVGGVVTGVY